MIGCFILFIGASILVQITWVRAYMKAKMLYYDIYYFHSFMYFISFVLGSSLQSSQALGQFFKQLYNFFYTCWMCSVHLIPQFELVVPLNWNTFSVLKQCLTFFINPFINWYNYLLFNR
jgi:hypothetical protein